MRVRTLLALAVATAIPSLGYAQGPGMTLFQERCATCHMATPPPDNRAPSLTGLRNLSPEAVLVAITTGPMAPNATGLTDHSGGRSPSTSAGARLAPARRRRHRR